MREPAIDRRERRFSVQLVFQLSNGDVYGFRNANQIKDRPFKFGVRDIEVNSFADSFFWD